MKRRCVILLLLLGWLASQGPLLWAQSLEVDPTLNSGSASPQQGLPAETAKTSKTDPSQVANPVVGITTEDPMIAPLRATVSRAQQLPPEMYGQWNIVFTLLSTDNPNPPWTVHTEIWSLERMGDQVVLANKATGAQESISVDEVKGNTATFHHSGTQGTHPFTGQPMFVKLERPTLTVSGNKMTGTFTEVYYRLRKDGRREKLFSYLSRMEADRIAAGRLQVGPESDDLEFEIEEIQDERKSTVSSPGKKLETVESTLYAR